MSLMVIGDVLGRIAQQVSLEKKPRYTEVEKKLSCLLNVSYKAIIPDRDNSMKKQKKNRARLLIDYIDTLPNDTFMVWEKLVELILKFRSVYISQGLIGKWFGKKRQAIWRHIKILKDSGLLTSVFRGHRQTNVYMLPEYFFKEYIAHALYNRFTSFRQLFTANVSLLNSALFSSRKYKIFGSCKNDHTTKNVDNFSKKTEVIEKREEPPRKIMTKEEFSDKCNDFVKKMGWNT